MDTLPYQRIPTMSPGYRSVRLLIYAVKWIKMLIHPFGCFAVHGGSGDYWHLQHTPKTSRTLGKRKFCLNMTFNIVTPQVTSLFFILSLHSSSQQQRLAWGSNTSSELQSHLLNWFCTGQVRPLPRSIPCLVPRYNQQYSWSKGYRINSLSK